MMRRSGFWRSLGLTALGLMLGSLAIEGYLRLAEFEPLARALPAAQASFYGPDPDTGYAHRAGSKGLWLTENRAWVEINRQGLRDLDRGSATRFGYRIGIIGDSFVEALQVSLNDTFPYLAETANLRKVPLVNVPLLGPLLGKRDHVVEMLNLGLAGATAAVSVQRLRTLAPRLHLDGAIVILNASDLRRQHPDDTSEFVGYVPGPDGKAVLSHAFRETRGYRFRTSAGGRAMYWLLDHSRLALLLNNRKNAGLLAELAEPPRAGPAKSRSCTAETLKPHEDLWSGKPMGFAQARLDAILADLRALASDPKRRMRIVLALAGLPVSCPGLEAQQAALRERIRNRIDGSGEVSKTLAFFDLTAAAARHLPPGKTMRDLTGWGARIGTGHLNELGHQVYAEAIVELLSAKR